MPLNSINVNDSNTGYAHSIINLSVSGAKFNDLSAALAAVPEDKKRGGMTITFVLNSDKYVQYRLMLSTFTNAQFANIYNWEKIDTLEIYKDFANIIKDGTLSSVSQGINKILDSNLLDGKYLIEVTNGTNVSLNLSVNNSSSIAYKDLKTDIGNNDTVITLLDTSSLNFEVANIYLYAASASSTGTVSYNIYQIPSNVVVNTRKQLVTGIGEYVYFTIPEDGYYNIHFKVEGTAHSDLNFRRNNQYYNFFEEATGDIEKTVFIQLKAGDIIGSWSNDATSSKTNTIKIDAILQYNVNSVNSVSVTLDKDSKWYQGTSNGIDEVQNTVQINTGFYYMPIGTKITAFVTNNSYRVKVTNAAKIHSNNRSEAYLTNGQVYYTEYPYVILAIENIVWSVADVTLENIESYGISISIEYRSDKDFFTIPQNSGYYNIDIFGDCRNGEDDAPVIQAALQYIAFHGGGMLYLPNGIYELKTTRTYQNTTANIVIPSNDNSKGRGYVEVGIIGQSFSDEEKSKYGDWAQGEDEDVWEGGALLKSYTEGSICSPSDTPIDVIGVGKTHIPTIIGVYLNCNLITLKNFCVECYVAEDSYPKVNGINLCKARTVNVENIMVYGSIPTFDQGDPTEDNHYSAGVLLPREFCAPQNRIIRVSVQGIWRFGIIIGEHNVCDNLEVFNAISALGIGYAFHASNIGRIIAQACRYQLEALSVDMLGYGAGRSLLNIIQYDIEYNNNQRPYQCNYRGVINDKDNRIYGKLNYNIVRSAGIDGGYYGDSSFKKIGGNNIQSFSMSKQIQDDIYVGNESIDSYSKENTVGFERVVNISNGNYVFNINSNTSNSIVTVSVYANNQWWEQGTFTADGTHSVDITFFAKEYSYTKYKIEVSESSNISVTLVKKKSLVDSLSQ